MKRLPGSVVRPYVLKYVYVGNSFCVQVGSFKLYVMHRVVVIIVHTVCEAPGYV